MYSALAISLIVLAVGASSEVLGIPFSFQSDPVLPKGTEMLIDNTNAQAGSIFVTPTSPQIIYSGSASYNPGVCTKQITVNDESGSMEVWLLAFTYSIPIANLTQHQSTSFNAPGVNGEVEIVLNPASGTPGRPSTSASGTFTVSTPVCQDLTGGGEVLMVVGGSAGWSSPVSSISGAVVQTLIHLIAGDPLQVYDGPTQVDLLYPGQTAEVATQGVLSFQEFGSCIVIPPGTCTSLISVRVSG